jgi:hypothetical protein
LGEKGVLTGDFVCFGKNEVVNRKNENMEEYYAWKVTG